MNKNKKTPIHPQPVWSLYILECEDGSFYTGISPDPVRRFEAHRRGQGAAYTRMHKPCALRVIETVGSYREALRRERQVKKLSKAAKGHFIANPRGLPPPLDGAGIVVNG